MSVLNCDDPCCKVTMEGKRDSEGEEGNGGRKGGREGGRKRGREEEREKKSPRTASIGV